MARYREKFKDRSKMWDIVMIGLLLGSVVLVFVYEALDPVRSANTRRLLEWIDLGLVVFFVGEWVFRVRASAPRSAKYALRQSWELLGMVPLLLPAPGVLRALRLVRLVRILRVFKTLGRYIGIWQRLSKQSHLGKIGLASGSVTLVGATLVWLMERDVNPNLATFSESLWWAIVTVTTVGYGDLTPITPTGRFIAAGLMISGIGIIGLLASTLASALLTEEEEQEDAASLPAHLERLHALHRDGALSDAEYAIAKSKVLGSEA